MAKLEDQTLKELKETAKRLGMENLDSFKVRTPLLEVIKVLQKKQKEAEEVKEAYAMPGRIDEKIDNVAEDKKQYESKTDKMKSRLDGQPKVMVFLPLGKKEKRGSVQYVTQNGKKKVIVTGAYDTVILNGYVTYIPKGVRTEVPQQVAEELGQAMEQTAQAGHEYLVDRDEKVQAALS